MSYFIGIDGGGTKTHCIIADKNKSPLYECWGGPANFLMLGTETVSATIVGLIKECIDRVKINQNQIDTVLAGVTGAGRRSDAEILEKGFAEYSANNNLHIKHFAVESDARIALEGAFSGREGCILIAGTGSILFGKDSKERIYRVGGFGRFIGDEGSGFMIGKMGLAAAAKHYDGRGEPTLLTNQLFTQFKISNPEDLINRIYRQNFDLASFAPVVIQCAEQGDKIAGEILQWNVNELLAHLRAIKKKIIAARLKVAFIGGLIANDTFFSRLLADKIREQLKDIEVTPAENQPAYGAVIMASAKNSHHHS